MQHINSFVPLKENSNGVPGKSLGTNEPVVPRK